mmetsp:Transcript_73275/g.238360  ORF Transcript_73275/g.238360 Transcript_73275/m.238360 type:complete len:80 (+) Transcript_73275:64-303(+)
MPLRSFGTCAAGGQLATDQKYFAFWELPRPVSCGGRDALAMAFASHRRMLPKFWVQCMSSWGWLAVFLFAPAWFISQTD